MARVTISQPMLFPWPGFFEQLMLSDAYIYMDHAQFSKGSFTNRIQLLNGAGSCWMTIPLTGKGSFQKISDLAGADDRWKIRHRSLLQQSLRSAPYRDDALSIFDVVYGKTSLLELLIASIEEPARYMGIGQSRRIYTSSQLGSPHTSSQLVLDLVLKVGGDRYITGHGAANYLDHKAFEATGICVEYMSYSCTPWKQPGLEFTPYVSVLDLIGRTGPRARDHLVPATISWREFLKGRTGK